MNQVITFVLVSQLADILLFFPLFKTITSIVCLMLDAVMADKFIYSSLVTATEFTQTWSYSDHLLQNGEILPIYAQYLH